MKGRKGQGHLGESHEMALEVVSIKLQPSALPSEPPLFRGSHPDAMSLDQGLETLLTGQTRLQGSPTLSGVHV